MTELHGRAVKRSRAQAATDVASMILRAPGDLGLPVCDQDMMLAKDIITTAAFTSNHHFTGKGHGLLDEQQKDRDLCLQQFCVE